MPSPPNLTNITPPRVPLTDERTGLISREWYKFFLNLFNLTGGGSNVTSLTDLQVGPPAPQQEDLTDIVIDVEAVKTQPTQESALDQIAELAKQVEALSVLPLTSWVLSELAELQAQIDGLSTTPALTPVVAAALTEVDDTNVTLTLGGSPNTALLAATSLTLGWTGQLATSRGGTGLSSYTANGVVYASSTSALATGSNFTFDGSGVVVSVNSATAALRVTQTNNSAGAIALLVEDSTNPDATPFVIDTTGQLIRGYTSAIATVSSGGTATTPALQTVATTQAGSSVGIFNWSSAASAAFLNFSKSKSGAIGTRAAVVAGDDLGVVVFAGDDNTNFVSAAAIAAEVQGTVATGSVPAQLRFATTAVGGVSPTVRLSIDNAGYLQQLTAPVLPYQGAPTSKSGAATLTGAELVTGILNTTGTTYTITLPTGTNIEGALSWAGNNVSLDWWVINTASGTITIGANGNTTLGTLTIATGVSAQFRIRRTATNTFTVYRLG